MLVLVMKRRKLDENLLLLARFYRIMPFHLVHHFSQANEKTHPI
ncbi:hypothetical protein N646_2535 [Vibrio alginolyticus NBRC 15630 = ATCC 17749]|uniref:Uncharacterized protein n=1 Tax=Vibrio alginolyticus (strain ATCC 17749 / DSM 2171 / NBRC 15630 / NCIMB 1903 / NCTC 12160 / XII-53) TaxID=1219076 RepID=A0A2I3CE78_VIBAX|nr:hypothetical protein N646_2535 [Vibrio alginolyticus NBRC 15630 = ATCC 17749]